MPSFINNFINKILITNSNSSTIMAMEEVITTMATNRINNNKNNGIIKITEHNQMTNHQDPRKKTIHL